MSSFTTQLVAFPLDDGRNWQVDEPFLYRVGSETSNEFIIVPAGFITDFASIPQIFWNILPPWGVYGKAAVIHDKLYRENGKEPDRTYTRKQCDRIFLEAMTVLNVPKLTRWLIYTAVRLFGGFAWKEKGKKCQ
jgi:hypothetical protein